MSTNSQSSRNRPVIGVVAAAMVLVGGCGVEPVQVPTSSSSTTSTTPPPAPDKYSTAGLRSCPEIQQKMSGDLPPPLPEDNQKGPTWSQRICPFRSEDTLVVLRIQYWETAEDITGTHLGSERARKDFLERGQSREKDQSLNLGSDARWKREVTTGCTLEILDENAVVSAHSGSTKTLVDGDDEQCHGPVRELAKQFYAAVQPQ
ncbi:hypothetical protein ACQPW3_03520 [Actinosynnema sp. CA-248983]